MIKKKKNKKLFLLIFVGLMLLPIGCEKKETPPPQPAQQVKQIAKPLPPIQQQSSSAKVAVSTMSQFDFNNKKDPFKPSVAETKKAKPQIKSGFGGLPIQNYEVSQFKVLGIITGFKENNALVVDPAGKAYVVKAGMEIGKNNGRITRISTAAIEVFEQYRDDDGRLRKRTVSISLPRKE
jgi:type IV pilus assembly protein PilP